MTAEAAGDRRSILCVYFLLSVAIHVAERRPFLLGIWANNVFMCIKDRDVRGSVQNTLGFDLPSPWV